MWKLFDEPNMDEASEAPEEETPVATPEETPVATPEAAPEAPAEEEGGDDKAAM